MSHAYPVFLFDLDGTLLDTAPEFTVCLNTLLSQEQQPLITLADLRPAVSNGAKGMVEFGVAHPQLESLRQRFLALYAQDLGQQTVFFPGMAKMLARLSQLQIKWGIVTNKPTVYTRPLIKKFYPLNETLCVVAGDTLSTSKPHPAPLLHACEILGASPQQCWYIGDAKTDLEASRRAGMRCAIANYGYIPPNERTSDWQADHYLNEANDIEKLISNFT